MNGVPSRILDRDETIRGLQALARTRPSPTLEQLRRLDRSLLRSALVHFESLARARRAAGLAAPPISLVEGSGRPRSARGLRTARDRATATATDSSPSS